MERRDLTAHDVLVNMGGSGEMIKAPIDLQDLRRRLYVKAKAEPSWRFTASRLRLAAVAPPMATAAVGDSGANMIGLINLGMKCAGTRSAGNPHAACDVAGAGNGVTDIPSRARRGKPRIQTRDILSDYRASSRPYQVSRGKRFKLGFIKLFAIDPIL